mgnify:CR=1 FL=1
MKNKTPSYPPVRGRLVTFPSLVKSVLNEAQEVQNNLQVSSKECQMMIQEYKRKIVGLEKQVQNYQKQYNALNDLISLFIQTTK